MKIAIIGIGLIGGSVAKALKTVKPEYTFIGVDCNTRHCEQALRARIVDQISPIDDIGESSMIVLCTPVNASVELAPYLLDNLSKSTVLVDVGSTKQSICKAVEQHPKRGRFVASHPIAGTENSGPMASSDTLLKDKITIICDEHKSDPDAVERVLELYNLLQMKVIEMDSKNHDEHIAYVSHLSHISSFALGHTVLEIEKNEKAIFDMAGSGFASTVRLAKSSPDMWTPIFEQNSSNIIKAIDVYMENLNYLKTQIEQCNTKKLHHYMERTNEIQRVLKGIN